MKSPTPSILHRKMEAYGPRAWCGTTRQSRTRGYLYCGIVHVPAGNTLRAIAFKSGMADSAVTETSPGKGTK